MRLGLGVKVKIVVCITPSWENARASQEKGVLLPHDNREGHNWLASF